MSCGGVGDDRVAALRRLFGVARGAGLAVADLRAMAQGRGWGGSLRVLSVRELDTLAAAVLGRAVVASDSARRRGAIRVLPGGRGR